MFKEAYLKENLGNVRSDTPGKQNRIKTPLCPLPLVLRQTGGAEKAGSSHAVAKRSCATFCGDGIIQLFRQSKLSKSANTRMDAVNMNVCIKFWLILEP